LPGSYTATGLRYGCRLARRRASLHTARPRLEYLAGDVDDRDAIESALEGCAGVHVSLRGASDPR
jgi:hypothetical protein